MKKDFRDELGVVILSGFFDPIGKVSQIHTTPSSNHIVITQCHHIAMTLSINQLSTTHYLFTTYIGFTSIIDYARLSRPGRYGGLSGIPHPGDLPTTRLGGHPMDWPL
jgi:hypothetical protein